MEKAGYNRPQKRRMRRRIIAIALVLISALMLISDRQQKSMLASGQLSADDLSAKIMSVIATPVRGIEALFVRADERSNLYDRNVELIAEVQRLRPYEHKVIDLQLRVKNLEAILLVDNSTDIPAKKIVARSVSETNGPFAHSALINAGRSKGIAKGHAVMTVDGLYGHVVRVGNSSSRVLLLNDLNSRVSVMSQRSQSRAILAGNNNNLPKLDYISPEADWKAGDIVVTSGDGGVLPRALPIGVVSLSDKQRLVVDLYVDNKPIDWVWVYPFEPIEVPEDSPPDQSEDEVHSEDEAQNGPQSEAGQ